MSELNESGSNRIRLILTAVIFFILLTLICGVLWDYKLLPALRSTMLSPDWGEDYVVSEKRVPVDLSVLPAQPMEQDFASIAVQLLDRETGFTAFCPTFIMWTIPCGSDIYAPSKVDVSAEWYGPADPDTPYRQSLDGSVYLWPQRSEAEINILGGMSLVASKSLPDLDLAELEWHVDDVMQLAEIQGGQKYRQAIQDQCEISLRLSSSRLTWLVKYHSLEGKDHLCVTVDRQTGDYTTSMTSDKCGW